MVDLDIKKDKGESVYRFLAEHIRNHGERPAAPNPRRMPPCILLPRPSSVEKSERLRIS